MQLVEITRSRDILLQRVADVIVVAPGAGSLPKCLDALLRALASCEPGPVVLDLRAVLLTDSVLRTVHAALCGPAALTGEVGLVAARGSARRRLVPVVACRGTPMFRTVAAALSG